MPNISLPVPHIPQRSSSDCLAACAAMLLGYLGVSVGYERLLRLLGVRPFGTPGSRLYCLAQLGLNVRYTCGSLDQLFSHLEANLPCIALVRTGQLPYWSYATDHAVVVVGCDDHSVYLNDPAFESAPQRAPHAHFELAWMEFECRYATISR